MESQLQTIPPPVHFRLPFPHTSSRQLFLLFPPASHLYGTSTHECNYCIRIYCKQLLNQLILLIWKLHINSVIYIEDISEIHRTEPYVYSQMIAGKDAPKHGEAKNSWLTGTAAWTFVNVSQYILGIRPSFDGLEIDPCICSEMDSFTATRKYRGATYHITVNNPNHVEKGIKKMRVNGKEIQGSCIKAVEGITEYYVEVIMG